MGGALGTAFASDHGLTGTCDLQRVPVRTFEELRPWVDRVLAGEADVLYRGPTALVTHTSGTTGMPKRLPTGRAALLAIRRAQELWGQALRSALPGVAAGRVLPLTYPGRTGALPSGLPVGSVAGVGYALDGAFEGRVVAVPAHIRAGTRTDLATWAAGQDLSLIAAAAPSAVLGLLDALPEPPSALWPKLAAVATWQAGPSALYAPRLREHLGDVPLVELGWCAAEGWFAVQIPGLPGAVPLATHYGFAFAPGDADPHTAALRPLEALEVGERVRPVVTTAGLYRYDLGDVVLVTGHLGRLPLLRFDHRATGVSSLCGEKLSEAQVVAAVAACVDAVDFEAQPVWPSDGRPRYRFRVEVRGRAPTADVLDAALCAESFLYAQQRRAGALERLELVQVDRGTFARDDAVGASVKPRHLRPEVAR